MTEAVIIYKPDWFLYDNGLRHERVKLKQRSERIETANFTNLRKEKSGRN